MGERLYNGVKDVITVHLEEVAAERIVPAFPQPIASEAGGSLPGGVTPVSGGPHFLLKLQEVWDDHTTCMLMIKDILLYMDRVYVTSNNVPKTYDMGLDLFRDFIIRSPKYEIQKNLMDSLLYQIQLEREGEMVERSVLKSATRMMVDLTAAAGNVQNASTVYEVDFETRFLATSEKFYELESQQFLRECDAAEYLKRAERRLKEEEYRIKAYLIESTQPKIRGIVEKELLEKQVKTIIEMENSGLVPMVTHEKISDLARMYQLFGRVSNGHSMMRTALSDHIKELAKNVNEVSGGLAHGLDASVSKQASSVSVDDDAAGPARGTGAESSSAAVPRADPIQWVEGMLALKQKFDMILDKAFGMDRAFQNEMNAALEFAVNQNSKAPEFSSLFIDENLRKGLKGKSEEEMETLLDRTITLFRFIGEKDIFERYYKQHLAKRLLYGRSISEDAEKSMIAKLKTECGYQFTTKLEGMFNDMRLSNDTMSDFRDHLSKSVTASPNMADVSVNVLTSTFWPMNSATQTAAIHFPPEINAAMDHFQRFYLARHSGRRLTWLTHIGFADLKATFAKGKKEINVSTFGMVVLMQVFNDTQEGEAVPYTRIREITAIPDAELKRTLQSLSLAKYKILLKSTKTKEIHDNDTFTFNNGFTSPLSKIKILTISSASSATTSTGNSVENEAERSETMEKIDEARKHQIEAAVVRIMKARKTMDHNNLVAEVIGQLVGRFSPNAGMVKKRIEGLIEREYLDRDKSDR
ncbi:hypothetical protein HDV00_004934 [Rhizophlyctis rosea]|nr:hypothetical protein HDV00_004934 [Rhizophlyctis rosea]